MSMPDPGTALHIASLDYYCTFSPLAASAGPVTFSVPDPVRFSFVFDTGTTPVDGSPGVVQVAWSYSWFTQATVEADIAATLNAISTAVATMLGLTQADVQAVVTIRRIWQITPNMQGPGVSSGSTALTDAMIYPAA